MIQIFEYNGFEYISNEKPGSTPEFNIKKKDSATERPESLSKYYAINENNISALENNHFYVAQPDDFNDLFDSSEHLIDFSDLNIEGIVNPNIPNRDGVINKFLSSSSEEQQKIISNYKNCLYNLYFTQMGILCMTQNTTDERMWGYYNNNEGYCLSFDYTQFSPNFAGPFPINYVENLSPFKIHKGFNLIAFLLQVSIKKDIWKSEDEYRFLVYSTPNIYDTHGQYSHVPIHGYLQSQHHSSLVISRLVKYPRSSIKSIVLGFKFVKDLSPTPYDSNSSIIKLNPEEFNLKKRLLDAIINQGIDCYGLFQETDNFSIDPKKWIISKISEVEYKIALG